MFLLFFFTGIGIVIYLNQYPIQPRERDYAYAGSFYAYAIWIGLGVYGIFEALRKYMNGTVVASLSTILCLLLVPGVMAKDGWDDHDRSNTYTARDFAKNYLDSCAPNAILFTNGDNDTFPLWYVQEVEEYRTDVRVCNLSLLNTDWYIDQMRRKAYDSEPIPFGMEPEKYRQGTRDYVPIINVNKQNVSIEGKDGSASADAKSNIYVDIKELMDFISDDRKKGNLGSNRRMNYFPTNQFSLKVDSAKVVENGTVPEELAGEMVDRIKWKMKKSYVMKNDMMILDLLANNNWDRPVYFAITTGSAAYIGLQSYFQLEGLAYRLLPVKTKNADGQTGRINTEIMYDNLVNKFQWGGMDEKDIYLNENNRRMCMNLRNNFSRLAEALIDEGKKDKAVEVLDKCLEVMPERNVPYDFFMLPITEAYYNAGELDKANEIINRLFDLYEEEMEYYLSLDNARYKSIRSSKVQQAVSLLYRLNAIAGKTKQEELAKDFKERFEAIQTAFGAREGMVG